MKEDIQGLLRVLHAAENEFNFSMSYWENFTKGCGTTHCMIGAFCDQNEKDDLLLKRGSISLRHYPDIENTEAVAERFSLTKKEVEWLFVVYCHTWYTTKKPVVKSPLYKHTPATTLNKEKALARLRKFIYYKLHKQEMIVEVGRNKQRIDQGRYSSGRSSAVLACKA